MKEDGFGLLCLNVSDYAEAFFAAVSICGCFYFRRLSGTDRQLGSSLF
jgi:hypothetical protein